MKTISTEINIFNEEGIFSGGEIIYFCNRIENQKAIKLNRSVGNPDTSIFNVFKNDMIEFLVYNHGYVMGLDGDIKSAIILLREIDKAIDESKHFYVSPFQIVENREEFKFTRNQSLNDIAKYLDIICFQRQSFFNIHATFELKM